VRARPRSRRGGPSRTWRILRAAGSSLDRVVQVTLLIQDPADYREINAEYVKHFPGGLPARHTARFGVPTRAKVAFACIALAPDAPRS
jgi:2-iminobutanoate/2-iminopropanoate deaminase